MGHGVVRLVEQQVVGTADVQGDAASESHLLRLTGELGSALGELGRGAIEVVTRSSEYTSVWTAVIRPTDTAPARPG